MAAHYRVGQYLLLLLAFGQSAFLCGPPHLKHFMSLLDEGPRVFCPPPDDIPLNRFSFTSLFRLLSASNTASARSSCFLALRLALNCSAATEGILFFSPSSSSSERDESELLSSSEWSFIFAFCRHVSSCLAFILCHPNRSVLRYSYLLLSKISITPAPRHIRSLGWYRLIFSILQITST